jgi:hypothetical protein
MVADLGATSPQKKALGTNIAKAAAKKAPPVKLAADEVDFYRTLIQKQQPAPLLMSSRSPPVLPDRPASQPGRLGGVRTSGSGAAAAAAAPARALKLRAEYGDDDSEGAREYQRRLWAAQQHHGGSSSGVAVAAAAAVAGASSPTEHAARRSAARQPPPAAAGVGPLNALRHHHGGTVARDGIGAGGVGGGGVGGGGGGARGVSSGVLQQPLQKTAYRPGQRITVRAPGRQDRRAT